MKRRVVSCLLSIALVNSICLAEDITWTVADKESEGCKLITPKISMDDSQGETKIWLELAKQQLLIKTESELDNAYNDLAIQVDDKESIKSSEIVDKKNLVFKESIKEIIPEFIEGRKVVVNLRFWPTWPSVGIKTISFSLIGFTKAYNELNSCKKDEAVTKPQ
ncbi:MAG: hypothetical protein WBP46_19340 [Thiolinea sp.]